MNVDRRKSKRHCTKSLIALTPKGVAQVVNLSAQSVFFRMKEKVHFQDYLVLDLYDAIGLNMVGILAKKVWSKTSNDEKDSDPFRSVIVARFEHLTPAQEYQLNFYLRQQPEQSRIF